MFLAVLLAILKFILYFVLISLAIIFIVSLIILVSAIKYDVHIKTSDLFTNPKGTMARVNVSWLFGILKLKIVYIKNKLKTQVFVFGLCVNRKRRKGKNAKEGLDYENTEVTIASDDPKLKTRAEPQGGVENKNIEIKNI
ncbi:MAG: hypothetical protein LBV08_08700 [Clostridiales bacterium]|nr:hypothetical protein [Clostridiales bacterium]